MAGYLRKLISLEIALKNAINDLKDERLREARFIDATENSLDILEANEFTDARL